MFKFDDLTGKTFVDLTVIKLSERTTKAVKYWECKCSCGNIKHVRAGHLKRGNVKSCGCLVKKRMSLLNLQHGQTNSPTYMSWWAMIKRCTYKKTNGYERYGGRGIKVCDRWLNFNNFFTDMGSRPKGTQIDRIDVNGNYEPGNCRWATLLEQGSNRKNNIILEYKGERKTLTQWSRAIKIDIRVLYKRLQYKWTIERVLTTPIRKMKTYNFTRLR